MRHTPRYVMSDPEQVKSLARRHPWITLVSATSGGLVASHYPALLVEDASGIVLATHFARSDAKLHELGRHEVLVIVQGPHDYVSPSWYAPGDLVPTWNHVTAHLYGTPEVLSDDDTYAMLAQLTDRFEHHRPGGRSLSEDEEGTRRLARGTVGARIEITRFEARAKLSQNKEPSTRDSVIEHLAPHNPELAAEMRRAAALTAPPA